VTLVTGNLTVFPHQRITSPVVTEETSLGPLLLCMAGLTAPIRELPLVFIHMAGETRRSIETQKGAAQVLAALLESVLGANQRFLVTAAASETRVGPLQCVARLRMVECSFALLTPVHQFEIHPVVLHMATLASLLDNRRVKSKSLVQLLTQQLMAVQTALGGDPLLLAMTLQTSIAALEICMWGAQRSRRDLSDSGVNAPSPEDRHEHGSQGEAPVAHREDQP